MAARQPSANRRSRDRRNGRVDLELALLHLDVARFGLKRAALTHDFRAIERARGHARVTCKAVAAASVQFDLDRGDRRQLERSIRRLREAALQSASNDPRRLLDDANHLGVALGARIPSA